MRQILHSITRFFRLPAICALCNQYHGGSLAICEACTHFFLPLGPHCKYCALPLPDSTFLICGNCALQKPAFDQVFAAYYFEEPLRTLLHTFKYREGLYLRDTLAALMLTHPPTNIKQTQCLLPVPMHSKRLRQRGFNQAAELTKYLARFLNLTFDLSLCKKRTNTASQASLKLKERHQNLQGAFIVNSSPYREVTLIDDLLTTGSTANEIARILKQQGVAQVNVWCCARAVRD